MRDEIGHSYLVIGNRIMGWESWGQAMPTRRQTTQSLRQDYQRTPETTPITHPRTTDNNVPQEHDDPNDQPCNDQPYTTDTDTTTNTTQPTMIPPLHSPATRLTPNNPTIAKLIDDMMTQQVNETNDRTMIKGPTRQSANKQ